MLENDKAKKKARMKQLKEAIVKFVNLEQRGTLVLVTKQGMVIAIYIPELQP